jgi:hypothetical protein
MVDENVGNTKSEVERMNSEVRVSTDFLKIRRSKQSWPNNFFEQPS